MSKHSGKIAVVSGGTGGLGHIVCERLLTTGAEVIALHSGRRDQRVETEKIRHRFPLYSDRAVDVTDEHAVQRFYDEFLSVSRRVDILCNLTGGILGKSLIEDLPLQQLRDLFRLNAESCFLMMRGALRSMKVHGFGRIINIAARPAVVPEPMRGGYDVAKAAVVSLTRAAAEEVRGYQNITVNAIAPGTILTDANKEWGSEDEMKKWVTPEQIADTILMLCGERGAAMNGQIIHMFEKDDHGIT